MNATTISLPVLSPEGSQSPEPVRFHLSLNVTDIARSAAFYRVLFDRPPTKIRHDYAKFELDEPPVVLSLIPASHAQGGALNHLGIRVRQSADLVDIQARLEAAGLPTQREEGVDCCYSRQTKFWIADPDRNLWEMYVLLDPSDDHDGQEHPAQRMQLQPPPLAAAPAGPEAPSFWQHFLTAPLPDRIPHDDASLDEVRLEGFFNMRLDESSATSFLREVRRVLRPGGRVFVHGLVADGRFPGETPSLPGPAAWVKHVPLEGEPLARLAEAGFIGVQCTKLAERPNFTIEGVAMREIKLAAEQPSAGGAPQAGCAIYRGPHAQVVDDAGHVYPRGARVRLDAARWSVLKNGPTAEQFAFLTDDPSLAGGCCP